MAAGAGAEVVSSELLVVWEREPALSRPPSEALARWSARDQLLVDVLDQDNSSDKTQGCNPRSYSDSHLRLARGLGQGWDRVLVLACPVTQGSRRQVQT